MGLRRVISIPLLGLLWLQPACDEAKTVAEPEQKAEPEPAPKPASQPEPAPQPEPQPTLPSTPATFEDAVAQAQQLYAQNRRTFFCECIYTATDRTARGTCGYETRSDEGAAKRIAWDHVVPVRAFGAHLTCWKGSTCADEQGASYGGVRCCRDQDRRFAAMEADLHNLVPMVAELQQDRSNYGFGEIEGEERMYGACDIEVDRRSGLVEVPDDRRGDVARTYLYMFETYGPEALPLSMQELKQFRTWHEADPPSPWELQRAAKIQAIQGTPHPYLSAPADG